MSLSLSRSFFLPLAWCGRASIKRCLFHLSKGVCFIYQKVSVSSIKRCLFHLSKGVCFIYQKVSVSSIKRCLFRLSKGVCLSLSSCLILPLAWCGHPKELSRCSWGSGFPHTRTHAQTRIDLHGYEAGRLGILYVSMSLVSMYIIWFVVFRCHALGCNTCDVMRLVCM